MKRVDHESVIAAAAIDDAPIYHIGPYAPAMGFYAVQMMALNLVQALFETSRLRAGDRVALVGTGPTALTLAAALKGFNCFVDMFTNGSELMPTRSTYHRFVHPTISQWPVEGLSSTTRLPFLDWYADNLANVSRMVLEKAKPVLNAINLDQHSRVLKVIQIATGLVMLALDSGPAEDRVYNLVLLADDFGQPPKLSHEPSYWEEDDLERRRDSAKFARATINGATDSGLIDALRLAHRNFDGGALAVEIADDLTGTGIPALLARQEIDSRELEGLVAASRVYQDAVRQLPMRIQGRLANTLNRQAAIVINDPGFRSRRAATAAPIYKLLVAHAMSMGVIQYRQSAWRGTRSTESKPDSPDDWVLNREPNVSVYDYLLPPVGARRNDPQELDRWSPIFSRDLSEPYPVPTFMPAADPSSPEFMRSRMALAEDWVRRRFGLSVLLTADGFRIQTRAGERFDLSSLPDQLFGVPVSVEPVGAVVGWVGSSEGGLATISTPCRKAGRACPQRGWQCASSSIWQAWRRARSIV